MQKNAQQKLVHTWRPIHTNQLLTYLVRYKNRAFGLPKLFDICRYGALLQYKQPWDLWVSRTLLQNGIVILVTWHLFLAAINSVSQIWNQTEIG